MEPRPIINPSVTPRMASTTRISISVKPSCLRISSDQRPLMGEGKLTRLQAAISCADTKMACLERRLDTGHFHSGCLRLVAGARNHTARSRRVHSKAGRNRPADRCPHHTRCRQSHIRHGSHSRRSRNRRGSHSRSHHRSRRGTRRRNRHGSRRHSRHRHGTRHHPRSRRHRGSRHTAAAAVKSAAAAMTLRIRRGRCQREGARHRRCRQSTANIETRDVDHRHHSLMNGIWFQPVFGSWRRNHACVRAGPRDAAREIMMTPGSIARCGDWAARPACGNCVAARLRHGRHADRCGAGARALGSLYSTRRGAPPRPGTRLLRPAAGRQRCGDLARRGLLDRDTGTLSGRARHLHRGPAGAGRAQAGQAHVPPDVRRANPATPGCTSPHWTAATPTSHRQARPISC